MRDCTATLENGMMKIYNGVGLAFALSGIVLRDITANMKSSSSNKFFVPMSMRLRAFKKYFHN
jgi:hypothetical protein